MLKSVFLTFIPTQLSNGPTNPKNKIWAKKEGKKKRKYWEIMHALDSKCKIYGKGNNHDKCIILAYVMKT